MSWRPEEHPTRDRGLMVRGLNSGTRLLAALAAILTCFGCGLAGGTAGRHGPDGMATSAARFYAYVTAQQSDRILVIDTGTNTIVKRLTHADLVRPANGKFHASRKRFYAGGVGKITVWDTTDLANPVYLRTLTPRAGSTGEYRGVVVYKGSATAIDGDVYSCHLRAVRGPALPGPVPDISHASRSRPPRPCLAES